MPSRPPMRRAPRVRSGLVASGPDASPRCLGWRILLGRRRPVAHGALRSRGSEEPGHGHDRGPHGRFVPARPSWFGPARPPRFEYADNLLEVMGHGGSAIEEEVLVGLRLEQIPGQTDRLRPPGGDRGRRRCSAGRLPRPEPDQPRRRGSAQAGRRMRQLRLRRGLTDRQEPGAGVESPTGRPKPPSRRPRPGRRLAPRARSNRHPGLPISQAGVPPREPMGYEVRREHPHPAGRALGRSGLPATCHRAAGSRRTLPPLCFSVAVLGIRRGPVAASERVAPAARWVG